MSATQITYWVRCNEDTLMEVSPSLINRLRADGYAVDIRITPVLGEDK